MVFSNLSVSFNQQSAIQFSRDGIDSLRRWTTYASEGLQNQLNSLQGYSPRAVITLIGTINILFFLGVRNVANRLETSLVQSSPAAADIRSATTCVLVGIAVGALNVGLSRLCRFHLSLLTLCTMSASAIALHLTLKQPVIIRQPSALPLPPSRLPPPPPRRYHVPKPEPKVEEDPDIIIGRSLPISSFLQDPPPLSLPKASSVRYDLTTPAPAPRPNTIVRQCTPIFSPSKLQGQSVKPCPPLNTQDYAQIKNAALIKMAELTGKKSKITSLVMQVENEIESLKQAMNASCKKKDGDKSEMSRISEQIRVKEGNLKELHSYLTLIDAENTKQIKLLEDIAKREQSAPENEEASAPDTPEGKHRRQLEIGVRADNISVPSLVSSLLFTESLAQMPTGQTNNALSETSNPSSSLSDLGSFVLLENDDESFPLKNLGLDDEGAHSSEEVVDFSEFELIDPDSGLTYLIDEKGFLYVMQGEQKLYLQKGNCFVNVTDIVLCEEMT